MSDSRPSAGGAGGRDSSGLLADEPFEPRVISSDVVFEGAVWNVRRDAFDYDGSTIVREYVAHTGAVAILAVDDEGRVLVIRQYRHPIRSREWELPAGLLDVDGEPELAAAQRELAEEADLVATDWRELVVFKTTPGGSDETVTVFQATGVSATETAFAREAEEADIEVRWVALDDIVSGVLAGRLRNSILAIAALAAHASR
ncbi:MULTISPECIES: NUDIX hydrolase [unclassified Frigoribacterium]|uniref:NUDIX domain-containing protein n=1 Tax=unclassified Frigoribacterium TaxID=2627005 RepID=UPI00070016FA|nr:MULTISPECIES: NUDIX hydrolase [unclassified Frigoribacterium]KQO83091.1 ADP-ribose pyrophosphatase [Frigoribacterium sp. Leaf263]KQR64214.1 ADP-ribose pyrophosphatase [Frigoribacterium sp. Leaf172]